MTFWDALGPTGQTTIIAAALGLPATVLAYLSGAKKTHTDGQNGFIDQMNKTVAQQQATINDLYTQLGSANAKFAELERQNRERDNQDRARERQLWELEQTVTDQRDELTEALNRLQRYSACAGGNPCPFGRNHA